MAMGSTSAMAADAEGGQLNFHGLVSATTCSKVVSTSRGDESTDGNIYLETATRRISPLKSLMLLTAQKQNLSPSF